MATKSFVQIFVLSVSLIVGAQLQGATLTVDAGGSTMYTSIQDAINDASANDIVFVMPGTYHEHVIMKDMVNLIGSGPRKTTIDGQGMFDQVVEYSGLHGAIISGFRITGSSGTEFWTTSGLCCWEGPLIVRNNIIEGNYGGICVHEARAKPTIVNNTIVGNLNGIILGWRADPPPAVDVAYIYNTDITSANAYASLLQDNHFSVDLIPLGQVAGTDFGTYSVIVVGSDTSFGYDWGTAAGVAAVKASGKPVLGLGFGGSGLFQGMGLSINWGHGWIGIEDSIYVVDPGHTLFNSPTKIALPLSKIIQLYTATQHIGEYAPVLSYNAVLLGREPSDPDHYPLVQEGKHILWGFTASPANMTATGKSLFINLVHYMHPLMPPPAKTHTIMNNIIADNTQTGIFYYAYAADGNISYNDVWNNAYRDYHDNSTGTTFIPEPGTGEMSANPSFADPDYRLAEDSACIDAGHPGPYYNDPDGTRNDMGAYGGPEAAGKGGWTGPGFLITDIGDIPSAEIIQDSSHPCHGLVDVDSGEAAANKIPVYKDCPFGGNLWIYGLFGNTDLVTHYQILVGKWTGSSEPGIGECVPLSDPLTKVKYFVEDGTGIVTYKYMSLGPVTIKNIDHLYELTRADYKKETIAGKDYWTTWSQSDLRMRWNTTSWENGKYIIRYRAYRYIPSFGIWEQLLGSNTLDHITLIVDNTPVKAEIHSVKYDSGQAIPECGMIDLESDTENLKFTITASHPSGYLKRYHLSALYGKNKNLGEVVKNHYTGLNEGAPPYWHGEIEQTFNSKDAQTVVPPQLKPWETCSYQFHLVVWARTTDGRTQHLYWDTFNDHYYINVNP